MANMICKQRLYLTADKVKLVADGDPKAAFLYAVPGDEILPEMAEKFGLVDGALPEKKTAKQAKEPAQTKPVVAPAAKPAASPETKPAADGEAKPATAAETKDA
ncbi:MAG: hypothetical protein MUF47_00935 [Porphyrobacter sp.]|jgi:hypothetical protein|nr:hypothetical protein [Porphyrobacter sp.]